jgi:TonB family protein
MKHNQYPMAGKSETGMSGCPRVAERTKRVWNRRGRAYVQILAALLGLGTLLLAEDAKKIPTDEAMSALVTKVNPEYPALARQLKLSGQVEVLANIDEDGSVGDVTTVSGNPVLAKAVVDAVKKWKFKPFKSKVSSNFTIGFHGVN